MLNVNSDQLQENCRIVHNLFTSDLGQKFIKMFEDHLFGHSFSLEDPGKTGLEAAFYQGQRSLYTTLVMMMQRHVSLETQQEVDIDA